MFLKIFRKVNLSLKQLEQWRRKWVDVPMSSPQTSIALSESRKPCLKLCSQRWLRPNLSLIIDITSFGLWHLKTLFPEGWINFKSIFNFSELCIFWFSFFPFDNHRGEKQILEEVVFYFEMRSIISISCVVWSHGSRNNIE